MSLQGGPIEDVPDPTCENDGAATTAPVPVRIDLGSEYAGENNDMTELDVEAGTRLDIMKGWIKTCNEHHGSPCVVSKADATVWPAWLIDVVDTCIVEGDVAERYLTLSYVWGGVQTLQLTTSNIDRLRQQRSLTKEEATLPRTIREALQVTRLLEERYIFVDQLCIVQDDQQHKMAEIEHMADIYANAYVTLVAIAGRTADCGLADNIEQWIHQYPVARKPTYYHKTIHDTRARNAIGSPKTEWNTRGWTFQERWSSGRLVYFLSTLTTWENFNSPYFGQHGSDYVSWNCYRANWDDIGGRTSTGSGERLNARSEWRSAGPLTWPNFSQYASEVHSYISRYFTYDSDVVPAFAGTASALAKVFPGGILYGLPIIFFDIALMWTFDEVQEIRAIDTKYHESLRPPSWSWMSWRGKFAYASWHDFSQSLETTYKHLSNYELPGVVFSPLVQWFYTGAGGVQIAIENGYHKYRYLAHDSESTPPLGWDRITNPTNNPAIQPKFHYATSAAPERTFWFPIPLVDPSDANTTIPKPISNLITCQTERAYFYLAREQAVDYLARLPIFDSKGYNSGRILGSGYAYSRTPEPVPDSSLNQRRTLIIRTGVDQKIELIAISTSLEGHANDCYERLFTGNRCAENRNDAGVRGYHNLEEWYNVLWIEWTDGIAYRKAVGQVTKEAWEAADRELIEVKLG